MMLHAFVVSPLIGKHAVCSYAQAFTSGATIVNEGDSKWHIE